jgi:hypothetical protein
MNVILQGNYNIETLRCHGWFFFIKNFAALVIIKYRQAKPWGSAPNPARGSPLDPFIKPFS